MWMRIRGVPADTFPRVAKVLHAVCWIIPFIIELVVVIRELRDAASYDWYAINILKKYIVFYYIRYNTDIINSLYLLFIFRCWLSNNGEAGDITVHSLKVFHSPLSPSPPLPLSPSPPLPPYTILFQQILL